MKWIDRYHAAHVHTRRVRVLAEAAARLLPADSPRLLDVGCGDGQLAAGLGALRPDVAITGVEVAPRAGGLIPVTAFDGRRLPFADGAFDAVMFVDVLHHLEDPAPLLREAVRVAKATLLVKDHLREGRGAQATLSFMDRIGNLRYEVPLPYHYLDRAEWARLWAECGLRPEAEETLPNLYPFPARLLFGRGLHFFRRLRKTTPNPMSPIG